MTSSEFFKTNYLISDGWEVWDDVEEKGKKEDKLKEKKKKKKNI